MGFTCSELVYHDNQIKLYSYIVQSGINRQCVRYGQIFQMFSWDKESLEI